MKEDAAKCTSNSDCMSALCAGNRFGLTEGRCAPYKLLPGAPCNYKESCGTAANIDRRCVGSLGLGRMGVCVYDNGQQRQCAVGSNKPGGCACKSDDVCRSSACVGNWFGRTGACQGSTAAVSKVECKYTGEAKYKDNGEKNPLRRRGRCLAKRGCAWCPEVGIWTNRKQRFQKFFSKSTKVDSVGRCWSVEVAQEKK